MGKSLAKNAVFKFILNLFNVVVPILIGPYLSRVLGPNEMGKFTFSETIYNYFFIFAAFGVYQYGLREISKLKDDIVKRNRVFTNLFVITTITNLLCIACYALLVRLNYRGTELYLPCTIMVFNLMSNVFYVEWVNEALENFDFITVKTIVIKSIYTVLLFVVVRSVDDLTEYMILILLANFANNIASYIYIRRRIKFDFKDLQILRHIKPMILVVILSNVNVLYTQFDKLMLGQYLNYVAVGFYTISQGISTVINALMQTLVYVSIPRLAHFLANDEGEYLKLLNKISKIYLLLLFPASIGMFVLSTPIVTLYGGEEYVRAIPTFSVFAIYIITLGYEAILTNQILYLRGKEMQLVKIVLVGGVINVLGNLLLLKINLFNPTTVIISTFIANAIVVIIENYYVKHKLKINFSIFSMDKTKYLIISLLFIPITWIISKFISGIIAFSLVAIVINMSMYFGILFVVKDGAFMEIMNMGLQKIKRK